MKEKVEGQEDEKDDEDLEKPALHKSFGTMDNVNIE